MAPKPTLLMSLLTASLVALTSRAEVIDNMCFPCLCVSQNEQGLYKVNCRSNALLNGSLPDFKHISGAQVYSLDMSNTRLDNLTTRAKMPFADYSNLNELNMKNTSINSIQNNSATIERQTFSGLDKLEYLNIAHNDQFPLTNETDIIFFERLTSLKKLVMYQTNLIPIKVNTGYPGPSLAKVQSLEELWIDGFSQVPFGEEFQNMTNLKIIRISGDLIWPDWQNPDFCSINSITDYTLANLRHVSNFSIIRCGVSCISRNAFKGMTGLRMLDLSMNYALGLETPFYSFYSLPSGIEMLILDSLVHVLSIDCPIEITTVMARSISHTALKMISLDRNTINKIDPDAFSLLPQSLQHIRIRANKFELGWYMVYAHQLTNVRMIEASYAQMGLQFEAFSNVEHPSLPSVDSKDKTAVKENIYRKRLSASEHHLPGRESNINSECQKLRPYIPPITITAFLPPKLEYIDVSNSKIAIPIYGFYIDSNNSIKTVNASGALLFCWDKPIHGLKSIENIDLSNNFCSSVHEQFFSNFPKLKRLYLQRNSLEFVVEYKMIFHSNFDLDYVDFSSNKINAINSKLFQNQNKMKWLNLSTNNLIGFYVPIFHMQFLKVLDLSENRISTLSNELRSDLEDIVSSRNNETLTVELTNNILSCSCDNLDVLEWILKHMHPSPSVLEVKISNCYFIHNVSSGYPSPTIISTKEDLIYQITFLKKFCASYTPLIISLVAILFVMFNIILASIIHRFRWKIRYWYYVGYNKEIKHDGYSTIESSLRDLIFKYDLYLAYEEDVKETVLDILKPKLLDLEYTVFMHDDILDGLPLYNVITKSIHASRVVVFVLSNGPRDSLEWKIAAHMTNEESNQRRKPMSVALFYNSDSTVGLPEELQLLRRDAFIDYPVNGSEQEITAFWEDFITKLNTI